MCDFVHQFTMPSSQQLQTRSADEVRLLGTYSMRLCLCEVYKRNLSIFPTPRTTADDDFCDMRQLRQPMEVLVRRQHLHACVNQACYLTTVDGVYTPCNWVNKKNIV